MRWKSDRRDKVMLGSVVLIPVWIQTSDLSALPVEIMISYLEWMLRDDAVESDRRDKVILGSVVLIPVWIQTSDLSALPVETMISYLEWMLRDDVVEVRQKEHGNTKFRGSYPWLDSNQWPLSLINRNLDIISRTDAIKLNLHLKSHFGNSYFVKTCVETKL